MAPAMSTCFCEPWKKQRESAAAQADICGGPAIRYLISELGDASRHALQLLVEGKATRITRPEVIA